MDAEKKRIFLCDCGKTMQVDGKAIGRALGCGDLPVHTQLCRGEIEAYRAALGERR